MSRNRRTGHSLPPRRRSTKAALAVIFGAGVVVPALLNPLALYVVFCALVGVLAAFLVIIVANEIARRIP